MGSWCNGILCVCVCASDFILHVLCEFGEMGEAIGHYYYFACETHVVVWLFSSDVDGCGICQAVTQGVRIVLAIYYGGGCNADGGCKMHAE